MHQPQNQRLASPNLQLMNPNTAPDMTLESRHDRLFVSSGILLGVGFAGFFDGIVLHQILQWHHMLTSVRPTDSVEDLAANTFWDGIFLMSASLFTVIGLVLFWQARQQGSLTQSVKRFVGALLVGAGGFNLIEGIIDHHLLGIHHVKTGANEAVWDIGFLVLNAVLVGLGSLMLRTEQRSLEASSNEPQTET